MFKPKKNKVKHERNYQDKSKYYVTNEALMAELIKWRDSPPAENGVRQVSEELGKMMYAIAKHLTYHWSFRHYSKELKEDMIGAACLKMIKHIDAYNFEYKNPFAYFTQICFNAFMGPITQYYKQKNLKKDIVINMVSDLQASNSMSIKSTYLAQIQKSLADFLKEIESDDKEKDDSDTEKEDSSDTTDKK